MREAQACTNFGGEIAAGGRPLLLSAAVEGLAAQQETQPCGTATAASSAGELPQMPTTTDDGAAGRSHQPSAATPKCGQTACTASERLPEGTRGAAAPERQPESPPSTPLRRSPRFPLKLTPERPDAPNGTDGRKRKRKEEGAIEENEGEKEEKQESAPSVLTIPTRRLRLKGASVAPEPSTACPSKVVASAVTLVSDESSARQQPQQQQEQ
eukprot:CAMPEP_0172908876 /NCGR_PEP_ID=MMETSP1075-20121228/181579_1 /TAXON_ID=2916 /ORGANISM="Ceratium fusus, Strain PA161109" /LENGTH=211 /DNA_ID=CAMNT_0013766729 /DNA_START=107 /DNA_END=739 /DNA_ORIENTATION=-